MSESEHLPASSEEELATEAFVDRIVDIHPNLDREELYETINEYVRDAVKAVEDEEESEDEESKDE